MAAFLKEWSAWIWPVCVLAIAVFVALVVHTALFLILKRLARRKGDVFVSSLVRHGRAPALFILPLLAILFVLPGSHLSDIVLVPLQRAAGLALIAAIAWLIILSVLVVSDLISARYRIDVADNLVARGIQTQIVVLHRIVIVMVIVTTVSVMLMTFPDIKHIGMSLLASAGLAGLVVGLAMKSTLSNLIAGMQVAFTQPIRLDDAVVVEGQWGWIEEIGATYVVVRIWDLRRLVLPLTYFIENPFENWTRRSADLLGSVMLYVDYSTPVEEVRQELDRIVKTTKLWKGTVCVLQVSDATEHTIQLRALVDARDSGTAWDLRCYVREKLIQFLQEKYPSALPKTRAELQSMPPEDRSHSQVLAAPVQSAK
jgi:small-conductance mechanosensitive channel